MIAEISLFLYLDGAVNSAGIVGKHHGIRPVAELEDEEWFKIIAVNLTGMMYSLRAELRKISDFGSSTCHLSHHTTAQNFELKAAILGAEKTLSMPQLTNPQS